MEEMQQPQYQAERCCELGLEEVGGLSKGKRPHTLEQAGW